jgi:hypothetical protein
MTEPALLRIDTVAEALDLSDAWQRTYERERDAHAETLRKLEIERILADDFAYWWQRQQD